MEANCSNMYQNNLYHVVQKVTENLSSRGTGFGEGCFVCGVLM